MPTFAVAIYIMDSLTQIVLGAAVGEVILGKKIGNKALLLGAIAGTIPDLDVVFTWINDDPIVQLRTHRAYSHSMFFHLLLALPFAWLSHRWSRVEDITFKRWYIFWYLGFFTHALLDCCTTYGTRLFLPFTNYQVGFNNISVIDPIYTLPFLLLLIVAMFFRRNSVTRNKIVFASIFISSAYMLLTFALKIKAHQLFREQLRADNISYTELNSTPTILNSILWSAIATNDNALYTAEYSFLKPSLPIQWTKFERNLHLLNQFKSKEVETVKWFADGNYFLQQPHPDTLYFFNTKWGRTRFDKTDAKDAFMFYYIFYKEGDKLKYKAVTPRDFKMSEAWQHLKERIGI